MNPYLTVVLLTFIPTLELRAAIPFGIASGLPVAHVVVITVVVNMVLAALVWVLLDVIFWLMQRVPWVHRLWIRYVERTRRRASRAVERYGVFALVIFIGIPLPGSGVYSGAVAASVLGMRFRQFFLASVLGVLIAAAAVTLLTLLGVEGWRLLQ